MSENHKCDVIIPVYNAYDAVIECINSVIENTDLNYHGLVLINDKSTDERILPLLKKYQKENKNLNIDIINNEENLGFVGTVNKGMKKSENDILLLNSDTVVPKRWLDNIIDCAYSGNKIATVTAMSNNATLASIPYNLRKNEIPNNLDFKDYACIVEKISYRDYPTLPTAHGFCMYIKRTVLDLLGYFDEDSFGKGYGEENDFSYRCMDYGFRNVLCDNVVVLHKESQSFSEKRKKLCEEHEKILKQRYPVYFSKMGDWCKENPIAYIGNNILYSLYLENKKNILILIHEWENSVGGTTLHVKDIVNGLKDKYNFHILYPSVDGYKINSIMGEDNVVLNLKQIRKYSQIERYNDDYKNMLIDIVKGLNISFVHIQHMIGHTYDIFDIIENYNIKSAMSLHDFYTICPTVNLLYKKEKYCMLMNNRNCKECLKTYKCSENNIIKEWQKEWMLNFTKLNKIIVPSNDTKNIINSVYPNIMLDVIEHGIDIKNGNYKPQINDVFNVAFVGVMTIHKGLEDFKRIIKETKNNKIKYHLFGISEDNKMQLNKKNYIYHGKYKRSELGNLLAENKINVVCFLQNTPETFSYTLQEVVSMGIPVISYNIGAGVERIVKNDSGWIIKSNNYKDVIYKIHEISNNIDEYNEKVNNTGSVIIKTIKQMNDEYDKIYSSGIKRKYDILNQKTLLKKYNIKYFNNNELLYEILNSTKWKLINKINFSTKTTEFIRKILRRVKK